MDVTVAALLFLTNAPRAREREGDTYPGQQHLHCGVVRWWSDLSSSALGQASQARSSFSLLYIQFLIMSSIDHDVWCCFFYLAHVSSLFIRLTNVLNEWCEHHPHKIMSLKTAWPRLAYEVPRAAVTTLQGLSHRDDRATRLWASRQGIGGAGRGRLLFGSVWGSSSAYSLLAASSEVPLCARKMG